MPKEKWHFSGPRFNIENVKVVNSRNISAPFFTAEAVCTGESCNGYKIL